MEIKKERLFTTSKIAKAGILSAFSFILYMFLKFPLPLFPHFLEINFSDIPALIGGFALGPIYGGMIVLVKVLLKLPFSSTQFVGEFADLIIGLSFIVPASIIYKKHKNIKGAVISLTVGSLASIIAAMLANRFILIPFYSLAYGFDAVVNMCKAVFPDLTRDNFYGYYIFLSVFPFNFIRCLIASLLTFVLYKKIKRLL